MMSYGASEDSFFDFIVALAHDNQFTVMFYAGLSSKLKLIFISR